MTRSDSPRSDSATSRSAADVAAESVASVYARALLGAAGQQAEASVAELDEFVAGVLDAFPKFDAILGSAAIGEAEKVRMLDQTIGRSASKPFLNFLKVLARHARLDIVRPIQRAAHAQLDELLGRVRVEVRTAHELGPDDARRLADSLRTKLGKQAELRMKVDPELIGGLVFRIGDTIYDASIARRLEQVRESMIKRSVHEIQSRRDRFCHSEGN